jgi:exoribonuclease R
VAQRRLVAAERAGDRLRAAFEQIRTDLDAPGDFAPEVLAEAVTAATSTPLPDLDLTDIPFVTVDPEGSRDLDQAMSLERTADGYRVHYAIADLGAFVRPGGPLDVEAHARGVTIYCPDTRVPLTPPVLSEDAASLLADADRAAVVWTMELDAEGEGRAVEVCRARVRSRAQLTFEQAQRVIDDGTDAQLGLLREVGRLRQARERARGGMSITLPEQDVVATNGTFELEFRASLPVEDWNAHLSLLTGSAAASLMVEGGVGILRTMPDPEPETVDALRRTASGLGVAWAPDASYAELVATLDSAVPAHAAFMSSATVLMRGAGYTAFDGEVPEIATHAAVGGPYTHVTAPLRRLVDRYATAVCLALCAGEPVPAWVRDALPALPKEMAAADRRAGEVDRACIDVVEAAVLGDRIGETFEGVVIDVRKDNGGTVQLVEPAVLARTGPGPTVRLGERIDVRLVDADVATRTVRFEPA